MRNNDFPEYTIDYISGVMSLRKPQTQSLRILDSILSMVGLQKGGDFSQIASDIHDVYPTFTAFDRKFPSFTFALATGVGKTRLMGVFITYLYTNYGIKNFFVVAPSLTIYNKLTNDLSNESSPKYVFKGVGCFNYPPNIITGEDYRDKQEAALLGPINIYIFNAQKFNSTDDKRKINSPNERLGESFMDFLRQKKDLVVIMDEAHHYRDNSTGDALDSLNPLLGLELTATPQVINGKKTVPFRNVVIDYPLAKSIRDGYTRTPFALTRKDLEKRNWTDDEMDKMMLEDGITWHEHIRGELKAYALNNRVRLVKPFMLVVCTNIEHAAKVLDYIKSDSFKGGYYKDKVIEIDSGKSGEEKDENISLLLGVESSENPVEIVVHVNMLKEGWDVNNLYTIVPLRAAQSRTLIEQTIGRGLRLPYGVRTGNKDVDSVTLTAHDNFQRVIEDAQRGDSIFRKENIISIEDVESTHPEEVQTKLDFGDDKHEDFFEANPEFHDTDKYSGILDAIQKYTNDCLTNPNSKNQTKEEIAKSLNEKISNDKDLAQVQKENDLDAILIARFCGYEIDRQEKALENYTIAFPIIETENDGEEVNFFEDFDLDVSNMNYTPVSQDVLRANMLHPEDTVIMKTYDLSFTTNPVKTLVAMLRSKSTVDYERDSALLAKLIGQFICHLKEKYSDDDIHNIIYANKHDISDAIFKQMMKHYKCKSKGLIECVKSVSMDIVKPVFSFADNYSNVKELRDEIDVSKIKSLIFKGGKKSILNYNKFDSNPEKDLAIACEDSPEVLKWLRPAPEQFKITYNHGRKYWPDFVIETADCCYLVEVKGTDMLTDPDVIAKKERAVSYCEKATEWCLANGHKPWKHLFIPSDKISRSSSFAGLAKAYEVK